MACTKAAARSIAALRTTPCASRRLAAHHQCRQIHSPAPLLLDFLAPSWQPSPFVARSRRPAAREAEKLQASRRSFSRSARRAAVAIRNARKDDEGNDMTISITPRAAHRLQTIAETDQNPELALRVAVESGGCHGFQYLMSLTNVADIDPAEDILFENEEVARQTGDYKAKVVMDEPSLELLKGSSVDYTMELIGSQFKVIGIPGAKSSCGCGTSFDIA